MKVTTDDDIVYIHRGHARDAVHGSANHLGVLEVF